MKDVLKTTSRPVKLEQKSGFIEGMLAAFGMRSLHPDWHLPTKRAQKRRQGHADYAENRQNAEANRREAMREQRADIEVFDVQRKSLVDGMTNWQRTQWARAGYPKDIAKVGYYAELKR